MWIVEAAKTPMGLPIPPVAKRLPHSSKYMFKNIYKHIYKSVYKYLYKYIFKYIYKYINTYANTITFIFLQLQTGFQKSITFAIITNLNISML